MISTRLDSLRIGVGTVPGGAAVSASRAHGTKPVAPTIATVQPPTPATGTPYFSTASTRARLDRFFNLDGTAKQPERFIVFDFAPAPDAVVDTTRTSLLLERTSRKVAATSVKSAVSKDDTAQSTAASSPKARGKYTTIAGYTLTRLDYEPVNNAKVMEEALKLSAKALALPKEPEQPNVMAKPDGTLILKTHFEAEGVKEVVRPWAKSLTDKVGHWLNLFPQLKKYARILPDGTVTLMNRFTFNPVRHWEDKTGERLTPYRLTKLPNGVIVDEKRRDALAKVDGDAKVIKKRMKDRVVAEVAAVEQVGYLLKPLPLVVPPAPMTVADMKAAEAAAKTQTPTGEKTLNPFAQV